MNDEVMHGVGDDPAWSESYYFNFVDPTSKLGMFTRMGFRPGSGWADALHVVYLAGQRVAFTYGRRDISAPLTQYEGDLNVGHLSLECVEPHVSWRIGYDGPAQDISDAEILLQRSKLRPTGWFTPANLQMELSFDCITAPHYAGQGERGHFEQSGRVSGTIQLDEQVWRVNGYGVRDKSWGPRDWGAGQRGQEPVTAKSDTPTPFVNWFSMNFGENAALGGSCFRTNSGTLRGAGWLQRGGESLNLEDVEITSNYKPNSIVHTDLVLTAKTETGEPLEIEGKVLSVCPTKIAMPNGATFVNEGLAEFRWGDQVGYGIAEHWHAVTKTDAK